LIDPRETSDGVSFGVRVVPRASRTEIVGEHDGALKIRIAAPPVDGAANAELIKCLAKAFSVSRSDIQIISGETSTNKRVLINGTDTAAIREVLNAKS
jgi:uncharacterized protein (TIGR00251 family)